MCCLVLKLRFCSVFHFRLLSKRFENSMTSRYVEGHRANGLLEKFELLKDYNSKCNKSLLHACRPMVFHISWSFPLEFFEARSTRCIHKEATKDRL
mmetsp:Transcript_1014/g.1976  ORF Transcript_1014/g.1976 Transcript_1014/m.1976 type:complete len:96 (+) Transcript_1014:634-921(+)